MINSIKSRLLPRKAKLALVEGLLAKLAYYSCSVAREYPEPVQLWYRRQLESYADRYGVELTWVFNDIAVSRGTTPKHERLIFLKELHAQLD